MRTRVLWLTLAVVLVASCERAHERGGERSDSAQQADDPRAATSRPAPIAPPIAPEDAVSPVKPPPPEAAPYLEVVYRYYARWDPTRETVDEFYKRSTKGPEWRAFWDRMREKEEQ